MKKDMMMEVGKKEGFKAPTAITFDRMGNMYVANWSGGTVSKVDDKGKTTTYAEIPGSPAGLACDEQGFIYVADYQDTIFCIIPDGTKAVFARGLHTPTGVCFDRNGNLLVTNRGSDELAKVSKQGDVSIIARGLRTPVGVVEHPDGNIYISNYGGGITKIATDGSKWTISEDFVTPGCGIIWFRGEIIAVDYGQGTLKSLGNDGKAVRIVARNLRQPVALGAGPDHRLYVGTWGDDAVHILE